MNTRYEATKEHRQPVVLLTKESLDHKRESISRADALVSLKQHYGWQLVVDEFIKPNMSVNNLIATSDEQLPQFKAGIKKLQELLNWIDSKIVEGGYQEKVINKLKNEEEK